jgi:hypothetical protein
MRIKLYLMSAFGVLVLCGTAWAQDAAPRFELFGGYSYMRTSGSSNVNGWKAQASFNINKWMGIAADFAGNYQTTADPTPSKGTAGRPAANALSFLVGPQFSDRVGRVRGFAQLLFGGVNVEKGFDVGRAGIVSDTTAFSLVAGGGVDVNVNDWCAVRAFSLDYQYIRVPDVQVLPFGTQAAGHSNIRVSIGLVFKIK